MNEEEIYDAELIQEPVPSPSATNQDFPLRAPRPPSVPAIQQRRFSWSRKKAVIAAGTGLAGLALLLVLAWDGASFLPWGTCSPEEGKFHVRMPGTPTPKNQKNARSGFEYHWYELEKSDHIFTAGFSDYPPEITDLVPPDQSFEMIRLDLRAALSVVEMSAEQEIQMEEVPGRQYILQASNQQTTVLRVSLTGNRLFVLAVTAPDLAADAKIVRKFFDSFHVDDEYARVVRSTPSPTPAEPRSFRPPNLEHYRLLSLPRVDDQVVGLAFLPDGKSLAVASNRGTIEVRNLETKTTTSQIAGKYPSLTCAAFSPDGRTVALGQATGTIHLLELPSLQEQAALDDPISPSPFRDLSFSEDGQYLIGVQEGAVQGWDMRTKKIFHPIGDRLHDVKHCQSAAYYSKWRMAAATDDKDVLLWNLSATGEATVLRGHGQPIRCLRFSPYGRYLATACADRVYLWLAANGQRRAAVHLEGTDTKTVFGLAFSPDGTRLAVSQGNQVWLLPLLKLLEQEPWHVPKPPAMVAHVPKPEKKKVPGATLHTVFDPQAKPFVSQPDPHVRIAVAGAPPRILSEYQVRPERIFFSRTYKSVEALTFSADGEMAAGIFPEQTIRILDARTGAERLQIHAVQAKKIYFSPDGNYLMTSNNGEVQLWNVTDGKCKGSFKPNRNPYKDHFGVRGPSFSGDGAWMAGFEPAGLMLFDAEILTLRSQQPCNLDTTRIVSAFSPNGRTIAAGGGTAAAPSFLKFWDVASGRRIDTEIAQKSTVCCLAFSPNSTLVASGSDDQTICLWDPSTGKKLAGWKGHPGQVFVLAFSLDGKTLASCTYHELRLWDVATGQERVRVGGHYWPMCLLFHPDQKRLLLGTSMEITIFELARLLEDGKK